MTHVKEISAKVSKIVNEFDLLLALKVQSLFIAGERGGGDPKEFGFIMTKFTRPPPPGGQLSIFTSLHSVGDDCTIPITPEYHVIPPKISQLPPPISQAMVDD